MSYSTAIYGEMWKAEMEKHFELFTEELADESYHSDKFSTNPKT
jgi:hypothetical protein